MADDAPNASLNDPLNLVDLTQPVEVQDYVGYSGVYNSRKNHLSTEVKDQIFLNNGQVGSLLGDCAKSN